jgi:hypothetical protein
MPIPLSEHQFLAILNASLTLPPADRDQFWAQVADELRDKPIGDGSVGRAIRIVQARFPHPEPSHEPHSAWRGTKMQPPRRQTQRPRGRDAA